MITYKRTGGRTIELFLPFEHGGVKVKEVVISPVRLDNTIRWQEGEYKSLLHLLAELAGLPLEAIRMLAYPDTDRVMSVFGEMLPPEIKGNIPEGLADEPKPSAQEPDAAAAVEENVDPQLGRELMDGEPPPPPKRPGPPPPDDMGMGLDIDGH